MGERSVNGVAICGFDRERVRFAAGFGVADVDRAEPVTPDTVFRVASISKLLTTALVLRLVDSGELNLDTPVNDYLPPELQILDRNRRPAAFGLRSLLSHSSGLAAGVRGADPGNRVMSFVANGGRIRNLRDAIAGLRTTHATGEKLVYSNPAFNVAGFIAAQVVGAPFESAVRDQVLAPLGMTDSDFSHRRRAHGVATPYGSILPPRVGTRPADRMRLVATPMGGLTSNVSDLARFGQMLLNAGEADGEQFLSNDIVTAAMTLEATNHPALEQGYGLGLKVSRRIGRTIIGHDGNMPGVATQMALSPADGVGVVVLTNSYALAVPHRIAATGLDHLIGLPLESTTEFGVAADDAETSRSERFARKVEGTFEVCDASPPGVIGRINDRLTKISVTHEGKGRLRIDGFPGSDGPAWLQPALGPGRYRVAAGVDDGTSAVIEERSDGIHIWLGYAAHLRKPRRG